MASSRRERAVQTVRSADGNLPITVVNSMIDTSQHGCVLKLLQDYEVAFTSCEIRDESAPALRKVVAKSIRRSRAVQPTRESFRALQCRLRPRMCLGMALRRKALVVEEMDELHFGDDMWCATGKPFVDCAANHRPHHWLALAWQLDIEMKANRSSDKYELWSSKHYLLEKALTMYGFNVETAKATCKKEKDSPERSLVRQCVIDDYLPQAIDSIKNRAARSDILVDIRFKAKKANVSMDDFDLQKTEDIRNFAADALNAHFMWLDEAVAFAAGNYKLRRKCPGTKETIDKHVKHTRALLRALSVAIDVDEGLHQCRDQLTNSDLHEVFERMSNEVKGPCDNETNCTEKPNQMCAEGSACDCQRPFTPKKAAKAGSVVFWGMWAAQFAAGAAIGAATGIGVPAGIAAGLASPGNGPAALTAMAAFSRSWKNECMCFPLACKYDKELQACALTPESTQRESNNIFERLPFSGFKCVQSRKSERHLHKGHKVTCELTSCDELDIRTPGPCVGDKPLFGKVGRIDTGVYNCANLEATESSVFGMAKSLPSAGDVVENTPQNRAKILRLFDNSTRPGVDRLYSQKFTERYNREACKHNMPKRKPEKLAAESQRAVTGSQRAATTESIGKHNRVPPVARTESAPAARTLPVDHRGASD